MQKLQMVISRGVAGPERAALAVARLFGLKTGGQTRLHHDSKCLAFVRRYGLSADACSRSQALIRNVRRADGTLVIGRLGHSLHALIKRQGRPVFMAEKEHGWIDWSVPAIVGWVRKYGICTLHVVGPPRGSGWKRVVGRTYGSLWEREVRALLVEVFLQLGHLPHAPTSLNWTVASQYGDFYAVVLWPRQRAWRWYEPTCQWKPCDAWDRLSLGRADLCDSVRLKQLIPQPFRSWVAGVDYPNLALLPVFSRLGKAAEDLADAGCWGVLELLARAKSLLPPRQATWRSLQRLARCRQRDIIRAFGFPGTKSAARILAKVPYKWCDLDTLLRLRGLMWDENVKDTLCQLPWVNSDAVTILSDPWLRRVIALPFLVHQADVCYKNARYCEDFGLLIAVDELKQQAERTGWTNSIEPIHSWRALAKWLRRLELMPSAGWPVPPKRLPGITGLIEPLLDHCSLIKEGWNMQHCVSAYADAVIEGHRLIFRILPDSSHGIGRATLELRPGPDGQWRVGQLLGPMNERVSRHTQRWVEVWCQLAHSHPDCDENVFRQTCLSNLQKANHPLGLERVA